jgi:hypothetical protein
MLHKSVPVRSYYFYHLSLIWFLILPWSLTLDLDLPEGEGRKTALAKHLDIAADRPQLFALIWHVEKTKCPLQRTTTLNDERISDTGALSRSYFEVRLDARAPTGQHGAPTPYSEAHRGVVALH